MDHRESIDSKITQFDRIAWFDCMKLIIFDMDQTLVEVLDIHNEAMRRVFQRLPRSP